MAQRIRKARDLREACLAEALTIIERQGLEELSLREVARRLGVSHQAPYKHFASRDHLLAELVRRAFASFARHLDERPRSDDPRQDLASLGVAYLEYARRHPLQYRLMFGTPLPDPQQHPEMMGEARHAFAILQQTLARRSEASSDEIDLEALFVWSTIHGIASLETLPAVATLGLPRALLARAPAHALARLGAALEAPLPARTELRQVKR